MLRPHWTPAYAVFALAGGRTFLHVAVVVRVLVASIPHVVCVCCVEILGVTCGDGSLGMRHCLAGQSAFVSRMRRPQLISWAAVHYGCRDVFGRLFGSAARA